MAESTPEHGIFLPTIETPTLTKAELSEMLFERLGLNKRESKDMVEAFFELVNDTLVTGSDVKLLATFRSVARRLVRGAILAPVRPFPSMRGMW